MIKNLILLIVSLILINCETDISDQNKKNINSTKEQSEMKSNNIQDTIYVKKWLTKVIVDYVNGHYSKSADENLQAELTEDYYNYKHEAITLEYSDMTKEEFDKKWKSKYDTKYLGNGGFFTSVMDNGKVEIPICNLIKSLGDTAKIFHTVVHDLHWKTDYKFDIKVVYKNSKLLIDDVKEYK